MKVSKPADNIASLKTLILQLQLSLELSQIQEILSIFNELLFLFTKYNFLFENDSSETQPIISTREIFESSLSTQDPARDGSNWYGYAGQNPITVTDVLGLYQLAINSEYKMQNYGNIYRNGTDIDNPYNKLSNSGCAIIACANMLSIISPEQINQDYVSNGLLQWGTLAKDYNYEIDDNRGKQFTVSQYNKQKNDRNYEYQTLVNVNYDKSEGNGGDHWVGVKGVTTRKNGDTWTDYVIIAASSDNDSIITTGSMADRKGRGWLYEDGNIYVPVSQTKGYINFKTKNYGETFRQILKKVFSFNKKKDQNLINQEQETLKAQSVQQEQQGPSGPIGSQEQESTSKTNTNSSTKNKSSKKGKQ